MSMGVGEKKILVVDDDEATRFLISDAFYILETGCTVTTARNGAEAVEVLQSVPVDFILTDLEMPVMKGYQLLLYIKNNYPRIPFLVMTGATSVEEYRVCALRVSQCIVKPFNVIELVQRIMSNFNDSLLSHMSSQQHHNIFSDVFHEKRISFERDFQMI